MFSAPRSKNIPSGAGSRIWHICSGCTQTGELTHWKQKINKSQCFCVTYSGDVCYCAVLLHVNQSSLFWHWSCPRFLSLVKRMYCSFTGLELARFCQNHWNQPSYRLLWRALPANPVWPDCTHTRAGRVVDKTDFHFISSYFCFQHCMQNSKTCKIITFRQDRWLKCVWKKS